MKTLAAVLLTVCAAPLQGQGADSVLKFSTPGWGGGPVETIHRDSVITHGGRVSARIERDAGSANNFTSITRSIPITFAGQTIELRGYLRTESVRGAAALWMREDGGSQPRFISMPQDASGLSGTTDWKEYSIRLPLDASATDLFVGALVVGQGKLWADGLQLLVDGKPFNEAPRHLRVQTALDTDHEFDAGSRVDVAALTPGQIDNLTTLGVVWGFLKYHHPAIADGKFHWDYELFRVLPAALAASDRAALRRTLSAWVEKLGTPAQCAGCAGQPADAAAKLTLNWIRDTTILGPVLSRQLQTIYDARVGRQFYVGRAPGAGNPSFDHEPAYQGLQAPDAGYRLLALYRLWNIVEYWYPNRGIIDENWHDVLRDEVPRVVAAATADAYRLEMMGLIARIHDTHANLWSSLNVRPPRGTCAWPVNVRFVEGRPAVVGPTGTTAGFESALRVGDVIETIGGQRVDSLVNVWLPYYAASNRPTQLRDVGGSLTQGDCGPGSVGIDRQGQKLTFEVARIPRTPTPVTHDRAGETFQLLSPDVAYIKPSSIKVADVTGYISRALGTRGLIIDIRNYPSEFVVFALGGHLVSQPTPFARFTGMDLANPGTFVWGNPVSLTPIEPRYTGKVVVLVDEVSQSQAEYTTMAYRAAGATVIGSTTAGADGNVSAIPLPGGLRTMISGLGVFYPDGKPTQRVGIVPDVVVTPTIAGIRDGRDAVLEAAVRQILGATADPQLIRAMTASH